MKFWSGILNTCTVPDCTTAAVTIPTSQTTTSVTINYSYDALYRLTAADYSDGMFFHYTYDAMGNHLMQQTQNSSDTYSYDSANRLTAVGEVEYSWDANGNLLDDGVNSYAYDPANRLVSVSGGAASVDYSYRCNGLSRDQWGITGCQGDLVSETVNNVTTNFVLDQAAGLPQVLSDGTYDYIYGLDRIAQVNGSNTVYFLVDALNSVRQLIDTTGTVTLAQNYQPYGEKENSIGGSDTNYGFAGEMADQTGLIYLRARYYNPFVGRFQSRDTWGGDENSPISYNDWLYANSNPINYVDPSGNITFSEADAADKIVNEISTYGFYVIRDWGIVAIPVPTPFTPTPSSTATNILSPSSECGWESGKWRSLHELELTRDGIKEMIKPQNFGSREHLETAMLDMPVFIHRAIQNSNYAGLSINNVILYDGAFNYSDEFARQVVVHESAHVWDTRHLFSISNQMMFVTKSYRWICEVRPRNRFPLCHNVYNSHMGEAPPTLYAETNPLEDWAETFMVYVYPSSGDLGPIRKAYVEEMLDEIH